MIENIYKGSYNDMANYSAQDRWRAENLKRFTFSLRIDTDQELINFIAQNKDRSGISEIIREALQMLIDSKK